MQFGNFGIWQILIILVVILLIFGPRRLPELAKNIGQSVREFRKGIRDMKNDIETEIKDEDDQEKPRKISKANSNRDIDAEWEKLRAEQEKFKREKEQVPAEETRAAPEKSSA